ncbi:hypothetical protein DSL60_01300, partial [Metamycoplasma hominis]
VILNEGLEKIGARAF